MPNVVPVPQGFSNPVQVPIPRVWTGEADIPVGRVWLAFTGAPTVHLKVSLFKGGRGWRSVDLVFHNDQDSYLLDPWQGETVLKVERVQNGDGDSGVAPAGFLVEAVLR